MTESEYFDALPEGYDLFEYRIESVLGQGGFGITYKAHDANLNKWVALKEYLPENFSRRENVDLVRPRPGSEEDFRWGLERFEREAQVLAQFDHPNIVPVLRRFTANGTVYMVMGYEEGESLDRILDNTDRLAESELEEILYPLLDGLAHLHSARILHRDIKPENIFIRLRDGSPVLLDFGAARAAIGARGKSVTRIITPNYAPYEQYYSEGRLGPWTDIYALASVIYEGITGAPPPEAPARVNNDPMVPAAEAGYGLYRAGFLSAIDWALQIAPEHRPQTIEELRTALPTPMDSALATATDMASILTKPRAATNRLAQAAYDANHRRVSGAAPLPKKGGGSAARATHAGSPAVASPRKRRKRAGWWAVAASVLLMVGGVGVTAAFLTGDGSRSGGQAASIKGNGAGPVVVGAAKKAGTQVANSTDGKSTDGRDGQGRNDGGSDSATGDGSNNTGGAGEGRAISDTDDVGDPAASAADADAERARQLVLLRQKRLKKLREERKRRLLAGVLSNRRLSTMLPGRRTLTLIFFHSGGKTGGTLRAVTISEGESGEEIIERGRWAAVGNQLCVRLSQWNKGRQACFKVRWRGEEKAKKRPRVPLIAAGRTGSFRGTLVRQ